MRTTLDIDGDLLEEAVRVSGSPSRTAAIELGRRTLVERAAARRRAALGGRARGAKAPPRPFDEHLEIKKLLLDAMRSTEEPGFDGKVAALKGAVEHHVEEEED